MHVSLKIKSLYLNSVILCVVFAFNSFNCSDLNSTIMFSTERNICKNYDLERREKIITLLDDLKFEYENGGNQSRIERPHVKKSYPKKDEFIFKDEFTYQGMFSGGMFIVNQTSAMVESKGTRNIFINQNLSLCFQGQEFKIAGQKGIDILR